MARKPQFRIAAIEDLLRQVRVVSPATRRREMDAAERLIDDLEPDRLYPLEFIVFRITGYRPQEDDSTLVGEALIADLCLFVQELSRTLSVPADYNDRRALPLDEVAARLNVSPKTVQRYRRQGLACHVVEFEAGSARLACFEDAVERFAARRNVQISASSSFSRIDAETEQAMIRQAKRLRDEREMGLNDAAAQIAREYDRAHETVRGMLRRHDRESDEPIFDERPPLSARQQRVIGRASWWGVSSGALAERFDRSAKTIQRIALNERAAWLAQLNLSWVNLATLHRPDAEEVLLSPETVRQRLNEPAVSGDAIELLEQCRQWPVLREDDEQALLAAYHMLKWRAARAIGALGQAPSAAQLDQVETDLRWAALLKRKVVAATVPTAVQRIEQTLHRSLSVQPADSIRALIARAVAVAGSVIESVDPQRGQRVARSVGYGMDRALASKPPAASEGRAAARHESGDVRIDDPFRRVCPWQRWIDRPGRWKAHLSQLDEHEAQLVALHYGWTGQPPRTLADLAEQFETTPAAVSRVIRQAGVRLRAFAARTL